MRVRVAATIEHAMDDGFVAVDPVVNGVGKAAGEQAMVAEVDAVDAGVENEGVDLGKQAVEKIAADSGRLADRRICDRRPSLRARFEGCGPSFEALAEFLFCFGPVERFHAAGGEGSFRFAEFFGVPRGTRERRFIGGEIGPERFDDDELFVRGKQAKFGEAHGWKVGASNVVARAVSGRSWVGEAGGRWLGNRRSGAGGFRTAPEAVRLRGRLGKGGG